MKTKQLNFSIMLAQQKLQTNAKKISAFSHPGNLDRVTKQLRNLLNPPPYRSVTVRLGLDHFKNPTLLFNPKGNLDSPTLIDEWEDCSLSEAGEIDLRKWWAGLHLKEQSNRNLIAVKLLEVCSRG